MTDPRIEFLKTALGVSDAVADATVNGGWPDVDSPDDKKTAATKKNLKSFKQFVQDQEPEKKAAFGPCDTLDESRVDFLAKYGTAADIHKIIDKNDQGAALMAAQRNPAFGREHIDKMLVHPSLEMRGNVLKAGKGTEDDVSKFIHANFDNASVVMNAIRHRRTKIEDLQHVATNHGVASVRNFAQRLIDKRLNISEDVLEEDVLTESEERDDFLAKYGSPKQIHQIIDGGDDRAIAKAMKNPAFTREHHERIMNHEDKFVQHAILHSPHVAHEDIHQLIHKNLKDPFVVNNAVLHHRTAAADLKWVALNYDHSNPNAADNVRTNAVNYANRRAAHGEGWTEPEIRAVKEKYNTGGAPKTYNAAMIIHHYMKPDADQLDEAKRDNFLSKYGSEQDITNVINNVKGFQSHEKYDAIAPVLKNPSFTRAHHEMLMNHSDSWMRGLSVKSPHLTNTDLDKLTVDEDWNVRADALDEYYSRKRHGLIKEEFLDESREEFIAKYGSAKQIHELITNNSDATLHALKNPQFGQEHLSVMVKSKSPKMRVYATMSPQIHPEHVSRLSHDPDDWVRSKAASSHRLPESDVHRLTKDTNENYSSVNDSAFIVGQQRKLFTKGDYEHLAVHGPTDFIKHASNHLLDHLKQGSPWASQHLKEDIEIPKIQAGIARQGKPAWASYWLENKQIWVPTEHIIADAKETHEGLSLMGEEFILFEEGVVKTWAHHDLAEHLMLSRSVHNHYEEAGIAHYPYKDGAGKVSMGRIHAMANYNHHSYPVNNTLHRNFHDQQRSWDAYGTVKTIDEIFHNAPRTTNPINTLSGLKQSPQDLIDHVREQGHDVGDHIYMHLPAYTSTSTMVSMAQAFAKRFNTKLDDDMKIAHADQHMFSIHVPAGHKMIGMMSHPDLENGNEHELILPRDTILKVNTKPEPYRVNNRTLHVWHAQVHGTNQTPLKTT